VKSISVTQKAALERTHGMPILFAYVDWEEGEERYVTAGADLIWDGYTWKGIGDLIDIAPIRSIGSVVATGVRFTLSGVESSRISQALGTKSQGRAVTLWFATLNPDTMELDDTPVTEFKGRLDAPALLDSAEGATVSISAESRMAALLGANVRRYTDADQQKFHPGDTFCKFTATMAEKLLIFPGREALRR